MILLKPRVPYSGIKAVIRVSLCIKPFDSIFIFTNKLNSTYIFTRNISKLKYVYNK